MAARLAIFEQSDMQALLKSPLQSIGSAIAGTMPGPTRSMAIAAMAATALMDLSFMPQHR